MTDSGSLPKNVSATFQRLSAAATELNAISDELGKTVASLDAALKRLNLGIPTWVRFDGSEDSQTGHFWARYVGYAKVASKWGIALSAEEGNHYTGEDVTSEDWLFNDAPRELRIEAVDHLPTLLEKLIEAADKATEKIKSKIGYAQTVVEAVKAADVDSRPVSKAHPPIMPVTGSPNPAPAGRK